MGVWDALKNISNKVIQDTQDKIIDSENLIDKNIQDDTGILGTEKRKIWVFNAGLTFGGNPKWLFVYINKYRPDIKAFWLCTEQDTVDYINSLGYKAFLYSSKEGIEVAAASGVYVVEQCKESIPPEFHDCVYLNLFHGVGCKTIERNLRSGLLLNRIMKKYVENNRIFLNNQLFLVTSPLMEEHFKTDIGLDDDMVIRGGYPRCLYQQSYDRIETFNHDIKGKKGRDKNTKVIVYSPTFRENSDVDFMSKALPDMKRLEKTLMENNQLLVFKMHPIMLETCAEYIEIKEKYENSPYFYFWDNSEDIYEIFDRIDAAIIDYSSIFYDFLAGGVKKFIRYFFDYDLSDNIREGAYDYKEMTCGKYCTTFDELIAALSDLENDEEEENERQHIYDLFWQYSSSDSMEQIIEAAMNFTIKELELPNLYSFDIFDTLVSRKGLHPDSIFYYVKECMQKSNLGFSKHLTDAYVDIRRRCEANVREYYDKTTGVRNSDCREISFDSIFNRMASLYSLTEEQITFLKETELNAELDNCIPLPEMITYAESLIGKGEDVILISDMYLPSAFIKKMIGKYSTKLINIPIYVSSEYGVQKSTSLLYQEVYKDIGFYKYDKWIHHGDNNKADKKMPVSLGITSVKHVAPTFNIYETSLIKELKTYDAYLVAAMMARFRERNTDVTTYFSYAYASLCIVTYTLWVLEDAIRRNIDTLYFIARDGYFPVIVAQQAIKKLGLKIKIKYIYGSRKVWRIPSFIDEIDESFFLSFGDLATAPSFEDLLDALYVDEEQFKELFPSLSELEFDGIITKAQSLKIVETVKSSEEYKNYLLSYAAEKRQIVEKYLRQEIDLNENFAFVDCWGRGYTQTCLTRLLHNIKKEKFDVPFYYVRSIYPTEGHNVRYNCTCKNHSMIFVEALFSTNVDYKSVAAYEEKEDGTVGPVIEYTECKKKLLDAMKLRLRNFTEDYLSLDLSDRSSSTRTFFDYSLDYFNFHQCNPVIIENLADLKYSVTVGGIREYAPPLSKKDVEMLVNKEVLQIHLTSSLPMSLARSNKAVVKHYSNLKAKKPVNEKQKITLFRKQTVKDYEFKDYNYTYDAIKKGQRALYNQAAKEPVENRIVIVNVYDNPEAEFAPLIRYYNSIGYKIDILPLMGYYNGDSLHAIATAKYIYMSNIAGWFSRIRFRKETQLIQLYREPMPLGNFPQIILPSYSKAKEQQIRRIHNIVYSLIPCAGEEIEKRLHTNFFRKENCNRTKVLGNPLTDVYFSEELKEDIRGRLSSLIPDNGKKLIVYLPQTTEVRKYAYNYLDIDNLKKLASDRYNLLVVSNQSDDIISSFASKNDGFVFNGNEIVSQREAMAVADVIIGDCSSVVVEGVLTGKPVFFSAPYYEKKETTPIFKAKDVRVFPVIKDSYSLMSYLEGDYEYDYEAINEFRENYFGGCDGHSTEKIHQYLEENSTHKSK